MKYLQFSPEGPLKPALAVVAVAGLVFAGLQVLTAVESTARAPEACRSVGAWLEPDSGKTLAPQDLFPALAGKRIVLLGESHTSREDHRWQLHTLAGLRAHSPALAVGFEMFPRARQDALDDWSAGRLTDSGFRTAARWQESWGYDYGLYAPLFHFVRQNRLPMIALNVDRGLVSRVGDEGWSAVPEAEREGVSDPTPASEAYRRSLAQVYAQKRRHRAGGDIAEAIDEAEIAEILGEEKFGRFVEAQLTWDRAMAEALFEASREDPEALVVGIVGRGHVEHGHGVPHQLADLGEENVAVLLPMESGSICDAAAPDLADAVFVVEAEPAHPVLGAAPPKPRLGVVIEQSDKGVRVLEVVEGSVAEATGLEPGDVILEAARVPVGRVPELIEIIQRQAPGTLLPLELDRDGERHSLIAEFPSKLD